MKKVGELLGAFFDDEILKTAKGYSAVFTSWRNIVGERLGAHSRIVELERAVLVVEADHPGWIQLVQLEQAKILENVKKMFPDLEINAISIRLGKINRSSSLQNKENRNIPSTDLEIRNSITHDESLAEKQDTVDPYGKITDESFKEILKRLERSIEDKNRNR